MATSTASVTARIYEGVQGGWLQVWSAASVNLSSISAGSTEDITITATGIDSSDYVLSVQPITKDTTLARLTFSGAVTSSDTITVTVGNPSAGALDAGSVDLMLLVYRA